MLRRSHLVVIVAVLVGVSGCGSGGTHTVVTQIPPSISAQPQAQTILTGKTATLTVMVTGNPPISYQWYQGTSGSGSPISGATSASYTTPPLTVTTNYWVQVSNSAGTVNSGTVTVTVTPPPVISTVSPPAGPLAGGVLVTLTGTGFQTGATVTFGGSAATGVTVVSATSITAVTPAHTAAAANVVVTNPDTQTGTCAGCYTYEPAPAPTSITPNAGSTAGGTTVSIVGTGFLAGATVLFGATAATGVTVNSGTSITAITPPLGAGTVPVIVTNIDGQSGTLNNAYSYNPPPQLVSLSPSGGALGGGTSVTLTGTGFQTGAKVTFNGIMATGVSVVSATTIMATTPANAAGTDPVVVTNSDLQSSVPCDCFTYEPAPTVTAVSPTNGSKGGGAIVTITGSGFLAGAMVTFGVTPATGVKVVSATSITATTPADPTGTANVVVTNTDTQSGTCSGCYTFNPPPTAGSISPNSGSTVGGTPVTITGSGFFTGATVTFGGAAATGVTVVSATSITAVTPAQAAGPATVAVTNPDGQTASISNGFTFVAPPAPTSISPSSGALAGGTSVTITGTAFQAGAKVTFGGAAATSIIVVSATSITATTPAHAAGAVNVVVTNPDNQFGTCTACYTYNPIPTVTLVVPANGSQGGGTNVTITGTGFLPGATVTFGGNAATSVVVVSSASITATTPAHPPANPPAPVNVVVINPDGQSGTCTCYTFNTAPGVTSVAPSNGALAGNTPVTITGTGFLAPASVTFGGTAATNVIVVSSTSITATTPAHSAGLVAVGLTNGDGQMGSCTCYTYNPLPTITSISPAGGNPLGGMTVTITGTGFLPGVMVTFGGKAATVVSSTSTTITVTIPANPAGPVNVVVTNVDGQTSAPGSFTYEVAPNPTSVTPNNGTQAGGTPVTITGTGFITGATVTFGGTAATNVAVVSSTSITATTPAHTPGPPPVNVVVTNPDTQAGTCPICYTYNPAPNPTSVSPSAGALGGGTPVTISGTGFLTGATVSFGGAAATNVTVVNGTTITATTPAHAAGCVSIVVTNPDNQFGTSTICYTYEAAPNPTSVSPSAGALAGGTPVTIGGTGFLTGATVTFGGSAATNVIVVNGTTITAKTPGPAAGPVPVVVTNPDTQSGTCACVYTYEAAPNPASINPNTGSSAGGTPVTISGTGFLPGATVTIGAAAATILPPGNNVITATTPAGTPGAAASVVVTNPDGQSGTCTCVFTYEGIVSSISPSSVGVGTPGFLLTVTGAGFTSGSTVNFNGVALSPPPGTTEPISATTLTAVVPTADIPATTAGSATITVSGATGNPTNPTLTFASPVPLVWDTTLTFTSPPWSSSTTNPTNSPVRLAFDSGDNSMFVAELETGRIDRVSGGTVTLWASLPVYNDTSPGYLGLLGMALDPANPPSKGGPVYVFYTPNVVSPTDNRIATLIQNATSGTDIVTGLPIDFNPAPLYLNGGKIIVRDETGGPFIYVSTGGVELMPALSQTAGTITSNTSYGKILRFTTSGAQAPATAFAGAGADYACGFRNSFGFDFHPSGTIYIGDNGNENVGAPPFPWYDALDRVAAGGGVAEGFGTPPASGACSSTVMNPLIGGSTAPPTNAFANDSHAPAGALFYTGTRIPQLQNTFVVNGEYITTIYNYDVDEYNTTTPGTVLSIAPVSTTTAGVGIPMPAGASNPVDMVQGPNGCIYVTFRIDTGLKNFIYRLKDSGGTACQ